MARILVVEDEAVVLVLAEGILKDAGHDTRTAIDRAEALAILDSGESFDLLFTDIHLKAEDHGGIELAQETVSRSPEVRVLYTTAGPVSDGMRALFVDDADLLLKPYTPANLIETVGKLAPNTKIPPR